MDGRKRDSMTVTLDFKPRVCLVWCGYDEGWDSFGESHTDTLVRKGEDNICKEFLEEFSGNCLVFTPQTPKQLQDFIKTCDNGLLAAAATCLLYTSPSPRDRQKSRMPSSA